MTASQEWAEEFNRLHARPGRRHAKISSAGYRILNLLKPYPWEDDGGIGFDAQQVGAHRVEISWEPAGDSFVVGHAHQASQTGFPRGDATAILTAFRRGGQARRRGLAVARRSVRSRYRRR